jgi:hypothetical protein
MRTMVGSTPYFGNSSDGKVMIFSGWADLRLSSSAGSRSPLRWTSR